MNVSYETIREDGGTVFRNEGSRALLAKVDAVVFDCDGTLIDVRKSYDATILKTTISMTQAFFGRVLRIEDAGKEFILQIRRTGGFNSDWDLTYALTLFSAAAIGGSGSRSEDATLGRLLRIVKDFSSRPRLEGWLSVDRYMLDSRLESKVIKELRRFLGYPGSPLKSRMASAFDEVYYGAKLYRQVYAAAPQHKIRDGLIDEEEVIIARKTLATLQKMTGGKRMAMATGRPFVAVEYTLGKLLEYFERDASVYIGDGDIFPELKPKLSKLKKPSGESLILARKRLTSRVLLYVGDSSEDRLMVQNAGAPRGSILFAGVYGSSFNDAEQISYFTKTESDLIVKNVNQIPALLEMARA